MKKMLYWTGVLTLTILFASCSSSRKASKSTPVTPGEIEVTIPLGGPEYQSDAEYWRAVQTGTSKDMSMAKKVAMQNARQDLAATVQHEVKAVIENYGQNAAVGAKNENEALYQEMARTVINQQMNGVELVGEKLFRLEDGSYRYHVCLQMSRESLGAGLSDALSNDDRLNLEFDKAQFKKVFDEEMARFAEQK